MRLQSINIAVKMRGIIYALALNCGANNSIMLLEKMIRVVITPARIEIR